MVLIGIAIFAGASAPGATPEGSIAEAWIIFWRVVQGAGAAIMFPAALAIVVSAYPRDERGKATGRARPAGRRKRRSPGRPGT